MVLRRIVAALAAALSVAPLCFAAESGVDSAANVQPIIVYYVQRLPFMGRDADGNLTGLLIQPVAKAFAKAGVPLAWRESSTSRQLAIIESNTGRACSLGRYMTADRAAFARFSVPFYQDARWVGLANVNFKVSGHVRIADLMADPHVTVLLKDDLKLGPYLDGLVAHMNAKRVGITSDFDQMIRMIEAGRADFSFITGEEETYYRDKLALNEHDIKVIHFADMPAGEKRYLMCSRLVGDAEMEKINAYLK